MRWIELAYPVRDNMRFRKEWTAYQCQERGGTCFVLKQAKRRTEGENYPLTAELMGKRFITDRLLRFLCSTCKLYFRIDECNRPPSSLFFVTALLNSTA